MLIPKVLENWTSEWITSMRLSTSKPDFAILPLAGDGSTRQFFRLSVPTSKTEKNFILLFDPTWTLSQDYPSHQLFLEKHEIPVPKFFAVDSKSGILVMEDLGDELLQFEILKNPLSKFRWFEKTVRLLAKLHASTFPVSPEVPAATRRFDKKKYNDELLFTLEHLHEKLLGLPKLDNQELTKISDFCGVLEGISPEVFSHRDYHCRNLLVHKNSLYMIDFQDARLGPPQYDLASLLYDAYVPLEEEERNKLIQLYKEEVSKEALGDAIAWDSFSAGLAMVGFQRTIKAAGSFASFYTRYQKKTHLSYLVPALRFAESLGKKANETASLIKAFPLQKWIERFESSKLV